MNIFKLPIVMISLSLALISVTVEVLVIILLFILFAWMSEGSSHGASHPFKDVSFKKRYRWFMDKFYSVGKFFKNELT